MMPPSQPRRQPLLVRVGILLVSTSFLGGPSAAQAPTPPSTPSPTVTADPAKEKQAEDAYLAGARMLDRRDYPAAETQFTRALELSPNNRSYLIALALTREHHLSDLAQHSGRERLLGHSKQADALLAEARALDPKSVLVSEHEIASQTSRNTEPWLSQHPTYA